MKKYNLSLESALTLTASQILNLITPSSMKKKVTGSVGRILNIQMPKVAESGKAV
jgi:hypothetical protein